jgi:hypothetical protein
VKRERRRFNVICNGRRWGKNILLQDLSVESALANRQPCAWAAPTYKTLTEDWKMLTNILAPVTEHRSEQEKQLRLVGGGVLDMWSLDNADSIRGRKYARFMVNEAAFVSDLMNSWNMVIRPTLIDLKGDAYFSGTPKGMNGFWQLYNMHGEEWANWQMSSYSNPHIPASELDALRLTMTERAFQQEILAQFLDDGGGVFRGVRKQATATALTQGLPGHQYVMGVDWGRSNDATVFCIVDTSTFECVYKDRMTDTDFANQRLRLMALSQKFNQAPGLVETNSIGQPQLEDLQRQGLPLTGFLTTNASKAQIIDALALAFEQEKIHIPEDEVLIAELMAYEAERLPSGLLRYGAPEGMHDDCVIALALAWWAGPGSGTWLIA